MAPQMSRKNLVLFLIALFLTNVSVMADMVVVPCIADLYELFSNSTNLVNFVISGPALFIIVASLICGHLMKHFSKKSLLIVGFSLFALASIFGAVIENVIYMAVMRAIVGFSIGIVNVSALSLLNEIFKDVNIRSKMYGGFNASMAGIGALMGLVAGVLAEISVQWAFKVYWISIPILLIVILYVPKTPAEKHLNNNHQKESMVLSQVKRFVELCMASLMFNMIYYVIFFQISVYISENALGNSAVAGAMSSLGTIGSMCACLVFGFVYNRLKRTTIALSYGIFVIGYLLLMLLPVNFVVALACLLMGAAFGNGFSYYYMRCTIIVPSEQVSKSIGILSAVNGIGVFISPYFVTYLQRMMGVEVVMSVLPVIFTMSGIGLVISIVLFLRDRSKGGELNQVKSEIADFDQIKAK